MAKLTICHERSARSGTSCDKSRRWSARERVSMLVLGQLSLEGRVGHGNEQVGKKHRFPDACDAGGGEGAARGDNCWLDRSAPAPFTARAVLKGCLPRYCRSNCRRDRGASTPHCGSTSARLQHSGIIAIMIFEVFSKFQDWADSDLRDLSQAV